MKLEKLDQNEISSFNVMRLNMKNVCGFFLQFLSSKMSEEVTQERRRNEKCKFTRHSRCVSNFDIFLSQLRILFFLIFSNKC